ncbi:MAG: glycerate kinase [Actinomycetota bacterium]
MRVLIAPDKFKGSLAATAVAEAMAGGVAAAVPRAEIVLCPMADGGDGTVETVLASTTAEERRAVVRAPLPGGRVEARWAVLPAGTLSPSTSRQGLDPGQPVALVEMAQASGLTLIPEGRRDPMATGTWGTGDLVLEALDAGCGQVVVGVGGSGTVDGGCGMAVALGYRMLDSGGRELPGDGASLRLIDSIDASGADPRLENARLLVATDVDNPLLGENGAARVFGPQKGAGPEQVEALEAGLANLSEVIERELGVSVSELPGAGAAGGLGAGLVAFCGAGVVSGFELVARAVRLEEKVAGCDLVLTGEGSFDTQSVHGKTPWGVARIASGHGVPSVIVAGRLEGHGPGAVPDGVATYCVLDGPMGLEEAMRDAAAQVRAGTARLMRLLGLSIERE